MCMQCTMFKNRSKRKSRERHKCLHYCVNRQFELRRVFFPLFFLLLHLFHFTPSFDPHTVHHRERINIKIMRSRMTNQNNAKRNEWEMKRNIGKRARAEK